MLALALKPARQCMALLLMAAGTARAHDAAAAVAPHPFGWNLAPWLIVLLGMAAIAYVRGVRRLWAASGPGRGVSRLETGAFLSGWLVLVAALVSPLDALGAWLFSAHMVQHELMMVVAAPLLVLGRPLAAWTWAMTPDQRRSLRPALQWRVWRRAWTAMCSPLGAWLLHAAALWGWHVPRFFDAALASPALHVLQHASFLASALLFWWSVLGLDMRGRFGPGLAFISLFTTMLHTGALGALLTFAARPWYLAYVDLAPALGLDVLQDQQLGGLVMWVPAALAYVLAALGVLGGTLARVRA